MILQNPKLSQFFLEASHIFASFLDWGTPGTFGFSLCFTFYKAKWVFVFSCPACVNKLPSQSQQVFFVVTLPYKFLTKASLCQQVLDHIRLINAAF